MKYNDSLLKPPGPVVSVRVSPTKRATLFRVKLAELDTGSDISVIPDSLVTDLRLTAKGSVLMFAYDKNSAERATYLVDLESVGYINPIITFPHPSTRAVAPGMTTVLEMISSMMQGPLTMLPDFNKSRSYTGTLVYPRPS